MPELFVDFITSLDGYGAAEGWPGFWGLERPNAATWAASLSVPGYAIDDQTAIRVSAGTVDVISEGHWKLFTH
jgi:hypothetical protein